MDKSKTLRSALRFSFRAVVFVVGLPLWITSIPALLTETTDIYEGDRLWLPYVGTALLFVVPLMFVWLILAESWAIVSGKSAPFPRVF